MSRELPDVEFTTHEDEIITPQDLEGKWWIADLIFTNCETVCIPMTINMTKIQKQAAEKDLDINFLSFSVDPENDTPEVLTEYAHNFDVGVDNWTSLTVYWFDNIKVLTLT